QPHHDTDCDHQTDQHRDSHPVPPARLGNEPETEGEQVALDQPEVGGHCDKGQCTPRCFESSPVLPKGVPLNECEIRSHNQASEATGHGQPHRRGTQALADSRLHSLIVPPLPNDPVRPEKSWPCSIYIHSFAFRCFCTISQSFCSRPVDQLVPFRAKPHS